jgi:hypothetical protein
MTAADPAHRGQRAAWHDNAARLFNLRTTDRSGAAPNVD